MRLRLAHQLMLSIALAAAVAVLAVTGFVAWHLRSGFADYLRARDEAWLDQFAPRVEQALAEGGIEALRRPRNWHALLESMRIGGESTADAVSNPPSRPSADDRRRDRPPPPGTVPWERRPPPPGTGPWEGRPPPPETGPWEGRPPPPGTGPWERRPPPPGSDPWPDRPPSSSAHPGAPLVADPARYGARLSLVDADGALLAGSRELAAGARLVRELIVGGQVVARLLLALPPLPAGADDVGFLVRQYRGIAGVGVAVLLLASLFAVLIARRWARPLQTMREASARIASGAFDVRVPVSGGDELADLGHDMNSMAASLARLELARRRWIAESAHELRTPLTVLRGEIEAMLDGVRPIDAAGIRSFQAEVGQLARLVDELHELAVTDMAERPSRLDVFDAHALARRTVDAFGSSARSRGVVLTCLAPAAQLQVHWDAGRIEQVLRNLLENALRYTDPPGRIDLRVESDGDRVRLIVDDSPPGVDPKLREQMFEPLWRADAARSRHGAGSGLGLAIVAGIVRQHRGTIAASDSPLGGLRITVTLPRDAGADREPRSPEVSDAGSPAPGLRRRG